MMKAVAASLLLAVANVEVGLSAQRLNRLIDQGFGLAGIFLIREKSRVRPAARLARISTCGAACLRLLPGLRARPNTPKPESGETVSFHLRK